MSKFRISTVTKFGAKYVCFAKDISLLFEFDENGDTKGLSLLPEQDVDRRCEKILRWNNKIIMLPSDEEKVYVYDYDSKELSSIDIPEDKNKIGCKFFNGFIYGDDLYMIGAFYPGILKINLLNQCCTEIDAYNDLHNRQQILQDCYTRKSILKVDNKLLIPSAVSNRVLCFDMSTENCMWDDIGEEKNRYSGIEYVDGNFWLSPRYDTSLIIFNKNGIVDKIELADYCTPAYNFTGIFLSGESVILPSLLLGYSLEINKKDKHIKRIRTGIDIMFEKTEGEVISQVDGGPVTICCSGEKKTIHLNLIGLYNIIGGISEDNIFFIENEVAGLSDLIAEVCKER